jgi:hypothetical protein
MKELEPEQAIVIPQEEQQVSEKHIGSINFLNRGHKVWKIELATGDITEAEYEKDQTAVFSDVESTLAPVRRKIKTEEGFFYLAALNQRNAMKKFIQHSIKVREANENSTRSN